MRHDDALARKVSRAEFSKRLWFLAIGVLLTAVLALQLVNTYQIRQTQTEGTPTGKRLVSLSNLVVSCVTPKGKCYQRSQRNQASVVATLNLGAVYAVFCVQRNPASTLREVKACVQDLYRSDASTSPSTRSVPSTTAAGSAAPSPAPQPTGKPSPHPSPSPAPQPSPSPSEQPSGGVLDDVVGLVGDLVDGLGL